MKNVVVIGGGAAGCMAAIAAAKQGASVTLLERTPRLLNKVRISGKGRCNVTNACDRQGFFEHIVHNAKFMQSSYAQFDNQALMGMLATLGVALKTERGLRVFPQSDSAHTIADALVKEIVKNKIKVVYHCRIVRFHVKEDIIIAAEDDKGRLFWADAFVLATGGMSYPVTGSSGDGYALAREMGHQVMPLQPSLAPIQIQDPDLWTCAGLSLKNVALSLFVGGQKVYDEQGEMLITHQGVSGPLVLSASAHTDQKRWKDSLLCVDVKPALTGEQLDQRLLREIQKAPNQACKTLMIKLAPKSLGEVLLKKAEIDPDLPCHQLKKEQRTRLCTLFKRWEMQVSSVGPMEAAIVTKGGVSVKQVNPKTMQSKQKSNLYLAGEVLDLDGYTGGFNLQIAFTTGYVAGKSCALEAIEQIMREDMDE